jgi:hypothetical protein
MSHCTACPGGQHSVAILKRRAAQLRWLWVPRPQSLFGTSSPRSCTEPGLRRLTGPGVFPPDNAMPIVSAGGSRTLVADRITLLRYLCLRCALTALSVFAHYQRCGQSHSASAVVDNALIRGQSQRVTHHNPTARRRMPDGYVYGTGILLVYRCTSHAWRAVGAGRVVQARARVFVLWP